MAMCRFSDTDILSILYSERDRLSSVQSNPGWSNWAVIAAIISTVIYLFDLIVEKNAEVDQYRLMLLSTLGIATFTLFAIIYDKVTFRAEIYYTNRVSTLWDESPILEQTYWTAIYISLLLWYIYNRELNSTFIFLSIISATQTISLGSVFFNRNRLVESGLRYNLLPNIGGTIKAIVNYIALIITIFFLGICPITKLYNIWGLCIVETKVAASIIAFATLIYMFLKLNSRSQNVINELDSIIDRVLYGGLSSEDAIEQLKRTRYGGNSRQVVQSELGQCISSIQKLTKTEQILDNALKAIRDGQIDPQKFNLYIRLRKVVFDDLKSANVKCDILQKKVHKMVLLPNSVKFAKDLNDLNDIIQTAIDKTSEVIGKAEEYKSLLDDYFDKFYCQHSGGLCEISNCLNRHKAMSVKYALKKYPFWIALNIIYIDWRKKLGNIQ